jgi:hypothetical protein
VNTRNDEPTVLGTVARSLECPRRGPECHYLSKSRTTGSISTCARCPIPNFCASTRSSCGIAVACKRTVECRLCSRGKRICSAIGRQACAKGIVGHDHLSHRVVPSVREHGSRAIGIISGLLKQSRASTAVMNRDGLTDDNGAGEASRSFSFDASLNGDENANEDFDYYWYVACCCLHDGDGRRAQPPEGDPRASSGSSTASRWHGSAAGGSRNVRADGCRQQIM